MRHAIHLQPGEIRRIPLQFLSTIQAVPELSTDFHPPVVIKPEINFSPDIQISEVYLIQHQYPKILYCSSWTLYTLNLLLTFFLIKH